MSTTDRLRKVRGSIGDLTSPDEGVHYLGSVLSDLIGVLIAERVETAAGKGSAAARTGDRSDAQPAEAPGEGRSEIGPQKGVQSLGDDLRDEASELCALANGKPYVVGVRPQDLIGIAQELDDYADRADALEAERDDWVGTWRVAADRAAAMEAERDEARAEVESLQRAAQVTDASWREHVERADTAEAAVARVRVLLDRPLIPSALLRDALDDHQHHDERPVSGAGMEEM